MSVPPLTECIKDFEFKLLLYFSQQILNKKYEQILELHNKRVSSNEICEKLNEGNIPYTLKYTFFEF